MAIINNLKKINSDIERVAESCGRDPKSISLLAVSKTKPIEMLLEAYKGGQRIFGENRVQEGEAKRPLLPADAKLHMIGHLQSNKVSKACHYFDCIQSVDSLKIARKINNKCSELDKVMDIFIDINISGESSKTGYCLGVDIIDEIKEISSMDNLNLLGLMAIGPNTGDRDLIKRKFKELRNFMILINKQTSLNLTELSIGMSGDYKEAIEAGSTMIRVGSSIFGTRG